MIAMRTASKQHPRLPVLSSTLFIALLDAQWNIVARTDGVVARALPAIRSGSHGFDLRLFIQCLFFGCQHCMNRCPGFSCLRTDARSSCVLDQSFGTFMGQMVSGSYSMRFVSNAYVVLERDS